MASQIAHSPHAAGDSVCRILLADDSHDSQALIRLYLHGLPYHLDVAEDGEKAVAMFQSRRFDIVILDQHMPVMGGFPAARVMREWESSRQQTPVPILALTADSSVEAREQGHAAGCTECLAKPIAKEQLLDALQRFGPSSSQKPATPRNHSPAGIAALIDEEIARRRPSSSTIAVKSCNACRTPSSDGIATSSGPRGTASKAWLARTASPRSVWQEPSWNRPRGSRTSSQCVGRSISWLPFLPKQVRPCKRIHDMR